ncbi:MAG: hypothetical protein IKL65_00935 [Bacilli bacterium]|nr:hypothetical protein [Bacilli bacterium]
MKKLSKEEALNRLEENNYKLAKLLKSYNISKFNLICCGNSISSGFSFTSNTKPLLFRNENIENIFKENLIDLKRYHFARAQDNNDEHILGYLLNDTKLSEICRLNRFDLKAMKSTGVDETNIDELYPLDDDTTIKKLINDYDSSNVIIYNGATGSFLDNITRGGKHYFTHGIKRDCVNIEAFLKYIQEQNRSKGTNVQVYLCGAPSILKASDLFINTRLKNISEKYANVVYVENIPKKTLYRKENFITPDTHYNEIEYLNLNNKILEKINENYLITNMLINIDRGIYTLNTEYQLGKINKEDVQIGAREIIDLSLIVNKEKLKNLNSDFKKVLKKIKNYLINRSSYDFYYAGKSNIKESVNKYIYK